MLTVRGRVRRVTLLTACLICLIHQHRFESVRGALLLGKLQHDAGFRDFVCGDVPIVCLDGAWSDGDVAALRRDAQALRALGFGAMAGVASRASGIRNGVHQIWLQSPDDGGSVLPQRGRGGGGGGSSLSSLYVGDLDARKRLFRSIDSLRDSIQPGNPNSAGGGSHVGSLLLPPHLVELSYLLYDGGGSSYAKHIDCPAEDLDESSSATRNSRRAVSFLLYLGGDGYGRPDDAWDAASHGGALRIHGEHPATLVREHVASDLPALVDDTDHPRRDSSWSDLAPLPGRMVLFDSSTVWHEVMPALTKRFAVVGWFCTPC
jgi:2OG-Fe(II) oxygenase superfamily